MRSTTYDGTIASQTELDISSISNSTDFQLSGSQHRLLIDTPESTSFLKSKSHSYNHTHVAPIENDARPSHGTGHDAGDAHGTVYGMIAMCTVLLVMSVILLSVQVYYNKQYFIPEEIEEEKVDKKDKEGKNRDKMQNGKGDLKQHKGVTFGGSEQLETGINGQSQSRLFDQDMEFGSS